MVGRKFLSVGLLFGVLVALLFWPSIERNPQQGIRSQIRVASAASSGPNNCGTAANVAFGNVTWTNPENACTSSSSTTASGVGSVSNGSYYLKVTNFSFSIPTGSVIEGIEVVVDKNSTKNKGSVGNDAAVRIVKGGTIGSTDRSNLGITWENAGPTTHGSSSDLWGESWSASDINASDFGFAIAGVASGGDAKPVNLTITSYITIKVYYNTPPNTPSQDSPLDGATGVSITPTFLMTATDPESDNVSYKVTIYSDSGCSSVVQTNDQAVSSTGWTGTDGSCTENPTSCYLSGTQGSYLTQSALSNNTQYWWKASAKDPDGNGAFTDSSTCNDFTTQGLLSISLTTDGSVSFDFLDTDTTEDTTVTGVDDVETVQVDSGPADLDVRSTTFTQGANEWTLSTSNGDNVVHWEFSEDGSSWTSFALADTLYSLDTNVPQGQTRDLYLRITTPTLTDSYQEYSATTTIVASAP